MTGRDQSASLRSIAAEASEYDAEDHNRQKDKEQDASVDGHLISPAAAEAATKQTKDQHDDDNQDDDTEETAAAVVALSVAPVATASE